ncbi:MAG: MFS transporter [Bacillota bacterium]|nr:MFS transporter [Bacillota bacterium]
MGRILDSLSVRLRSALDFKHPRQSYGVLLDGDTRRNLYLFTAAVCVGIMFTVITGFPGASPIFAAFLKQELGLSDSLFGTLLALPYVTAIAQIPFTRFLQRKPPLKQLFVGLGLFVRLSFVVLGLAAAVLGDGQRTLLVGFVFLMMALSSTVLWLSDVTFQTWLGVCVPPHITGRFFSTRQRLLTLAMLAYSLLVMPLTRLLDGHPLQYPILFVLAGLFGCCDILILLKIRTPEPAETAEPKAAADVAADVDVAADAAADVDAADTSKAKRGDALRQFFSDLVIPFRDRNYRPILLFSAVYYFGIQINSPYLNVYMLENLRIPLGIQTLLTTLMPGIATVLFITRTGRLSDYYGYRNSLLFFGLISALSPLCWLFVVPQTWWLIALINFVWGITGVATDLAVFGITVFRAPSELRPVYISAKAICANLFGIAPAILLGGLLSDVLSPLMKNLAIPWFGGTHLLPLHVLLLLAATIRSFAVLRIAPKLAPDNKTDFPAFCGELRDSVLRSFHPLRRLARHLHWRRHQRKWRQSQND